MTNMILELKINIIRKKYNDDYNICSCDNYNNPIHAKIPFLAIFYFI